MAFYSDETSFTILGDIDTHYSESPYDTFPYKVRFMSRNSGVINRNYLQIPDSEEWEIGVTQVMYKINNSQVVLIPTPAEAKERKVYDLYAAEVMLGPIQMFPINYQQKSATRSIDPTVDNIDLKAVFEDIFKLNEAHATSTAAVLNPLINMHDKLYMGMYDTSISTDDHNRFYAADLLSNSVSEGTFAGYHSLIFRWNYIDVLYKKYPDRFVKNLGRYGLFTMKELCDSTKDAITVQELAKAQGPLDNNKILGYKKYESVLYRDWYQSFTKSLPSVTLEDKIVIASDTSLYPKCKVVLPASCMYMAVGSVIRKLWGFNTVQRTATLYDSTSLTKIVRQPLDIICNNFTQSFVTPCKLVSTNNGWIPFRLFNGDNEKPVRYESPGPGGLFKLPATNPAQTGLSNTEFYKWVYNKGRYFADGTFLHVPYYSNNKLRMFNAGDMYLYATPVVVPTTHVGNILSPLLTILPVPNYYFALSKIDLSYMNNDNQGSSFTTTIKRPMYTTLERGTNLDDLYVSTLNEYGDLLFVGKLTVQFNIRRK